MSGDEVAVILPARDEAGAVQGVVAAFRSQGARVVVVDNGSRDGTGDLASAAGAEVVHEERPGYGSACLRGITHLAGRPPEIVVFADCDGTIDARDLSALLAPIRSGEADLVLGRRSTIEPGAYGWHQRVGNRLVLRLLRLFSGRALGDLPPLRAIRADVLLSLGLKETTYGFPVETVAATLRRGFRVQEVDVAYLRRRQGTSKVSGSLLRSLQAGGVMVAALLRASYPRPSTKAQIVVFARAPELGGVKTRLGTRYDPPTILSLYRAFLRDTLRLARLAGGRVVLSHSPAPAFEEQALADDLIEQRGQTFAERFDDALAAAHRLLPSRPVVIIGADAPDLPVAILRQAIEAVAEGRAVVGPAPRGGFYLLGFPGPPVSVGAVFREAKQVPALTGILETNGLAVEHLPPWSDVDEPQDVARLESRTDGVPRSTRAALARMRAS